MIKIAVVDLDGTVYKGDKMEEGADLALKFLSDNGVEVFFCTNNSSNSPLTIINKLQKMGITCDEDHMITSGAIAADYCRENGLKRIYVYGTEELKEYLVEKELDITDEDSNTNLVIGMDSGINYNKLTKAIRAAIHSNSIVVCNEDKTFPREDGIYPGCGCAVAAILYCSNREKTVLLGKPNVFMLNYIQNKTGCRKDEIIVIGDSMESDIKMANHFGCKSMLVGSEKENGLSVRMLNELTNYDWTFL